MPNVTMYDKPVLTGRESIEIHFETAQPIRTTVDELAAFATANINQGTFFDMTIGGVSSATIASLAFTFTSDNSDLGFTALAAGSAGNDIQIQLIDPAEETLTTTAELTLGLDGEQNILVTLAHDGNAITATANDVATAIDGVAAALLEPVTVEGTGLGLMEAKPLTALSGGGDATGGEVGAMVPSDDGTKLYVKVSTTTWKQITLDVIGA